MELMKKLRKASLRKVLLPAVILIAVAATVFYGFDCAAIFQTFFPKTLAELTPETIDGAYVEDDIYFIYTAFAEEEEYQDNRPTGKITGVQYIIDLDETYYIGLFAHEKDMLETDAMLEACSTYYYGEAGAEELPILHVRGTMMPMGSQLADYYLESAGGDSDTASVMLPYYLDMGRVSGYSPMVLWVVFILCLGAFIWGIGLLVKAAHGSYQKKMLQKLRDMGDENAMLEKLELFYDNTDPVGGVRMGSEFVMFQSGTKTVLLRPWDIAWAYQSTTRHRTNGIPTGKTHAAVLRTMDGTQYSLTMQETQVQKLLDAMQAALPGTVLGYCNETEQLYRQDRAAFMARWEAARPGCSSHP